MKTRLLLLTLMWAFIAYPSFGQVSNPAIIVVSSAPSGACTSGLPNQQVLTTGAQYSCQNGTWGQFATGGGSGFTAGGDLSGSASSQTVIGINGVAVSGLTGILRFATGTPSASELSGDCTTSGSNAITCTKSNGTALTGLFAPVPVVSQISGSNDLMCAQAADTTIGAQTITGGTSTASTMTYTMAAVPNYMYPGAYVISQGASPSGWNVTGTGSVIASVDTTHVTITNATNPGNWSSGGTISLACGNQTNDAIVAHPYIFQSRTLGANFWAAGTNLNVTQQVSIFSSASAPGILGFFLFFNSVTQYSLLATPLNLSSSLTGAEGSFSWTMSALQNQLVATTPVANGLPSTGTGNFWANFVKGPIANTASSAPIDVEMYYPSTGVVSGTYTSGGSITGSATQTCTLTSFNNSSTATATVVLTGTNTIAGGTALVITARGSGASAAPTSATLGNGTATCSGSATIATVLGGAPGNGILQYALVTR